MVCPEPYTRPTLHTKLRIILETNSAVMWYSHSLMLEGRVRKDPGGSVHTYCSFFLCIYIIISKMNARYGLSRCIVPGVKCYSVGLVRRDMMH